MVESRGANYGVLTGETVELSVGGTQISLQSDPLVNEFQIINAELGLAPLTQADDMGTRTMYWGSFANRGRCIVLIINDKAIASLLGDRAMYEGEFYTFVEVGDEELDELVLELKDSIVELQKKEQF